VARHTKPDGGDDAGTQPLPYLRQVVRGDEPAQAAGRQGVDRGGGRRIPGRVATRPSANADTSTPRSRCSGTSVVASTAARASTSIRSISSGSSPRYRRRSVVGSRSHAPFPLGSRRRQFAVPSYHEKYATVEKPLKTTGVGGGVSSPGQHADFRSPCRWSLPATLGRSPCSARFGTDTSIGVPSGRRKSNSATSSGSAPVAVRPAYTANSRATSAGRTSTCAGMYTSTTSTQPAPASAATRRAYEVREPHSVNRPSACRGRWRTAVSRWAANAVVRMESSCTTRWWVAPASTRDQASRDVRSVPPGAPGSGSVTTVSPRSGYSLASRSAASRRLGCVMTTAEMRGAAVMVSLL
jgi:hypothetical protein